MVPLNSATLEENEGWTFEAIDANLEGVVIAVIKILFVEVPSRIKSQFYNQSDVHNDTARSVHLRPVSKRVHLEFVGSLSSV